MPDNTTASGSGLNASRSVCIHTDQITDSCLDKDCIEALRGYLTVSSQEALDCSAGAKTRCAELLFTDVSVEPLTYKCGYYAVDLTFYYRIIGDAIQGGTRPTTICGLAIFAKRAVLYGGAGKAKIFRSGEPIPCGDELFRRDRPTAVVEALDPMILAAKVKEVCECRRCDTEVREIPTGIAEAFGEQLILCGDHKRLYVTIGQFSTVRLERGTQLTIPVCEYCAPTRECCDEECCEEDPCDLFSRIDFPMNAFFPESQSPGKRSGPCENGCGCG